VATYGEAFRCPKPWFAPRPRALGRKKVECPLSPLPMFVALFCIALAGAVSFTLAIGVVWSGTLVLRSTRRRNVALAVLSLSVAILTGIAVHDWMRMWHPIMTVQAPLPDHPYVQYPPFAISDDGSTLAAARPTPERMVRTEELETTEGEVFLWPILSGKLQPRRFKTAAVGALYLSPDGSKFAVINHSGVTFHWTSTGERINEASVPTVNGWAPRNCRFSPDGKQFVVASASQESRCVSFLDTQTGKVVRQLRPDRIVVPEVADGQLALLAILPAVVGAPRELALLDENGSRALHPPRMFQHLPQPFLSPDGFHVASGRRLLNLKTGVEEPLPGNVFCFVSGGQRSITRRDYLAWSQMTKFPYWQMAVPVLRRWCVTAKGGQAVLFDVATKAEVCTTPNYPKEAFSDFACSADGKTVVGRSFTGKFRVWRVPD
jgi:WD40 repeat protein